MSSASRDPVPRPSAGRSPANISIERRVEWPDTDAAGHHHHSVVLRWFEAAEGALLRAIGHPDLFGCIPRVRYEVDYTSRLWFGQLARIDLRVAAVGRTSLTYEFEVHAGAVLAARGSAVVVHTGTAAGADDPDSGAQPWDADVRRKLLTAGSQPSESFRRTDS